MHTNKKIDHKSLWNLLPRFHSYFIMKENDRRHISKTVTKHIRKIFQGDIQPHY